MIEIVTPCPRCGAFYLGQQAMVASITDANSYFGMRKVCRCGWKGRTFGPKPPEGIRYEPSGQPHYSQNWEALAREFATSLERCAQVIADNMAGNLDDQQAVYRITDALEPYCGIDAFAGIVDDEQRQKFPADGLFAEVVVHDSSNERGADA